ncbi:sensor domain-containing phosphodiesterase [Alcaligenaceae bacterium A4P071]|nr:sensor domain-containing phosphodiesterase [Alcaligenaceae bacterium C4P045]MDQ2184249.1 sensor domain-containing phosphodiesterase [Alcaligenaceae bacterium A4P071]
MQDSKMMEEERLAALHVSGLLDAQISQDFDQFTQLASYLFKVPTALISIVGRDRQRFLAKVGFELAETPRESSICAYAIQQPNLFEVADLRCDPRFDQNRLVVGAPFMRFYAGIRLRLPSGFPLGALCIIDVVPRQLSEADREQLLALARMVEAQIALRQSIGRRDAVSGMVNRQQMMVDLQALIDTAHPASQVFVLLDIFELKRAQEMAQAVGVGAIESLIRNLSLGLSQTVGHICTLYHVGVTRFAFWCEETQHDEILAAVCRTLDGPVTAAGVAMALRVHIGLVPFTCPGPPAPDILRRAITALNHAQKTNSRWSYYDRIEDLALQRRYRLAVDIQSAIVKNQLYLNFQPRIDLATHRIHTVEALLRWRHPELGEVSPGEFIPILERTASMKVITLWVLDRGLSYLKQWHAEVGPLRLSINLSPRDFDDEKFVPALLGLCRHYPLDPAYLEFEVTEGEWLRQDRRVIAQMRELVAYGATLAIDDFGAGYSNFAYLNEIPAAVLKLDQSLVRDIDRNTRHAALVEGILSISRKLGYRTVAEGVETVACAKLLSRWQCDEAQGYAFAKPMSAERLLAFMADFEADRQPLMMRAISGDMEKDD